MYAWYLEAAQIPISQYSRNFHLKEQLVLSETNFRVDMGWTNPQADASGFPDPGWHKTGLKLGRCMFWVALLQC